jgi:NAD(P)-dependent dehydrogenase (short-subunit alcohol dehydrogenase family)
VACADRDAGAAEATAALVRGEGQIAAVVLADVASPEECASVVAGSAAALGGLDGLVLNVGIGLGRGMAGTTVAQWDQTFAVNTRAHFLVAAAALTVLDPGSAIVFVSSAASLRAATGIPAYDASKAALPGICRQVAREGMARGIRANLVVPSLVDTPARTGGVAAQPGPHRAEPAVRQASHRLGSGLRHSMAVVRRIQLRQRAPAGPRRRRDQLRLSDDGLCDLTQTTSRWCRSKARKKPALAGARLRNRTTRSACAGTARRTGTSEPAWPQTCSVVRRE